MAATNKTSVSIHPRSRRQRKQEANKKKQQRQQRRVSHRPSAHTQRLAPPSVAQAAPLSSKPPVVAVDDTDTAPITARSPETIRPAAGSAMPGAPSFRLKEMKEELPQRKPLIPTPPPAPEAHVEHKTTRVPAGAGWQGPAIGVGAIALLAGIVGAMFYAPTPMPKGSHDLVAPPTAENPVEMATATTAKAPTTQAVTQASPQPVVQAESKATPKVTMEPIVTEPRQPAVSTESAPTTPWEPPITEAERAQAVHNATETLRRETPPELIQRAHNALSARTWPEVQTKPQQDAARIAYAMVVARSKINFSDMTSMKAAITAFTGRPKPTSTLVDEGPHLVH